MLSKIKNGFTLAEVLITLVIIGVVAALTIPTAINKYREQTLKSQFRKAYSAISQALRKTELIDFNGYAQCYYGAEAGGAPTMTDCSAFWNALAKNLHVQKKCAGNSMNEGCVPSYQSYGTEGCSGFNENAINNTNYSYVLSDGQIIIPFGANPRAIFLVDINGHKGPNAYGKDLFTFMIKIDTATNNVYLSQGPCEFPVDGGRTTQEMILYALSGKN